MASRWFTRGMFLLLVLAVGAPALAGGFGDFFASIGRDCKRRNCWPEPFVQADRQTVREPLVTMVANGWQKQNMLVDAHFESGGQKLSEAGRLKVQVILNEAPEQHRVVYVHRGVNPQETSRRIQAVQQFIAQTAYGDAALPPVLETGRAEDAWSAEQVDQIGRKVQAGIPDPKLPAASGSGTGAASGK